MEEEKLGIKELKLSKGILEQRTLEYSQQKEKKEVKGEVEEFLGFRLGKEWYLIEMASIDEVVKHQRVSHLPRQKNIIQGVMNIRGEIKLIVGLGVLLSMTPTTIIESSRVVLIKSKTDSTGFITDEIIGVLKLDTGKFQTSIANVRGIEAEFINGLYNKDDNHFIWLNIERVLLEVAKRLSHKTGGIK